MGMLFQAIVENNNFLKNIGQKNKGHSNLISMILFKQIFLTDSHNIHYAFSYKKAGILSREANIK